MTRKSTTDLREELMTQPDLKSYLKKNTDSFAPSGVSAALMRLHRRTGLTKAELARRAGMSEVYLHQLLSGRRNPSRDRLLCICVSAFVGLDETNRILKLASCAQLYPRSRRDAIIIHGIAHRRTLPEINAALFEEDEKTLS